MKAINTNKKYVLPLMLLGLLALDTSWHKIFQLNTYSSGDFASSELAGRAYEICSANQGDIKNKISALLRTHSANHTTFSFQSTSNEDFEDSIEVGDDQVDYKYRGYVNVEKLTASGPLLMRDIRNNPKLEEAGCDFDIAETAEEPVELRDPNTGRVIKQNKHTDPKHERFDNDGEVEEYTAWYKPIKRFQRYHILRVQVQSKTTEAEWEDCDDCDAKQLSSKPKYKCIKVAVEPNGFSPRRVCSEATENAIAMFQDAEKAMKMGSFDDWKDVLEAIEEQAEDDKDEERLAGLIESCKLKSGTSLKEYRRYKQKKGNWKDLTYAGEPEEKAECLVDNMSIQDSPSEKYGYFQNNVVPQLREDLSSQNPATRTAGLQFARMIDNSMRGKFLKGEEMYIPSHMGAILKGASNYDRVMRLTAILEQNPNDMGARMELDQLKMNLSYESAMTARTGSLQMADESSFWSTQISNITSTGTIVDPLVAQQSGAALNYNLAGRGARLAGNHTFLMNDPGFAEARAAIMSTPNFVNNGQGPGYMRGGIDAYNSAPFTQTQPPFPESSDRLARNRRP